ncbi:Fanconi anemia group M protein homolog isoform X2 [Macrobrachium nipponense]|uniref:Fanconi anemia group M protein homolog isoform X2 n=1 Tax=Macrobrachium nipponense TaxID=159736 RepID=UPI0030C85F5A
MSYHNASARGRKEYVELSISRRKDSSGNRRAPGAILTLRLDTNGMNPGPSYVKPANHQSFGNRPVESTSGFDYESGKTWIYPMNYPLRQYQYAIVEQALYKNTLVSLPTGLGKTFIAAVVMYNFYRWYPRCKVVFMAPTKPLVAQQVEACFNVVGIPQEDISQMTGSMAPDARIQEWKEKRLFFLTPQVLTNDFARGACPAELIKCLVLDEAHRALGNHAYCQVMRELRERRCEFRVLALSATPGSDIAAVKQVLTNLLISHIELRSEDSPDITPYSHHRNIEKIVVPLGEELTNTKNRFLNILRVYVDRLLELRVLFTKDATTLSKFQLLQARDAFRQNPPENLPRHRFGAVEGLFALCVTLYHAFDLMLLHGARSSYKFLKGTLGGDKGKSFARAELLRNDVFRRLMDDLSKKFEVDTNQSKEASMNSSSVFPQTSSTSPMKNTKESYMMSHPKMSHLCDLVVDHHQKFASEGKSTRIMIFSQYRDSVLEITEMLHHHEPLVKAMSFVGQGTVARGSRGISQKEQLRVVKQFKEGGFNTLVSTCVGEEGLDIGDVDLIICYDAPKSPIRLVQRMGRTGRKREGRIVVLITKGKEEQMYNASQYQKRTINIALANKEKLNHFLYTHCPKMIPAGISPTCQKLHMKVDEWKVPTKRGRKKALSSNSTLKFPSHSSSTHKEKHGFLSEEEWNWYRDNLWVPREDFKAIPKPSFLCLDSEEEDGNFIDLGLYQPWHNSLQQAHHIGHSSRSNHLVQLTEFVNLQVTIGPDEDPYGLEMAAFLDMSYVKDSYHKQLMVPEPKLCGNKRRPKIGKKSTVENNKTAKKNALITSMFPKISLSAFRNTQNNSQVSKGAINHEECIASGTKKVNDGHLDDSEDDDVTVIDGDFVQPSIEDNPRVEKNQFSQISNPNSQASDHLMVVIPTDKDHMKVDSVKEDRFLHSDANKQIDDNESNSFRITKLPLCGRKSPFRICSPPRTDCLLEWEGNDEPESPSEVLRAIDDWVEEKNRINLDDYSLDKPALNCLLDKKGVSSAIRIKNQMYDDDDDDDDLPNLNFSMRNVLSTSLCNKPKTSLNSEPVKMIVYAEDSDIEKNFTEDTGKEYSPTNELDILTPRKNDDEVATSIVTEVSPILTSTYRKPLRTNLKICSSTPKVNAKRLFKMTTPEITAIEKNSMLLTEETLTPNRGEIIKESNQTNASINSSASLANKTSTLSTGDRIHLKLSRFTFAGKESDPRVESKSCRDAGEANKNKEPDVVKDETCKFELYHIDPPDIGVNSAHENISSEPPVESFQRSSQRMLFKENTKSLGVCENIENSDSTDMTQNHQMNKKIEKQISKENNRLQKHASDYEGRKLVSARLNDSASNISPLKNSTKIAPHADKKDCSSSFRVTQQESNLEEKIIHRSFCKDNHPNVSSQDNKSLLKNTLDKVSFDLSLDEDIFADIEMNDFGEKEHNPSAADRHKESGAPSSKDYGGPINTFQPKSQRLLSVTQIIDIVDQSADETRNNKSVSESSFRMSKLSKKSPFQRKQGVSSVKLNAENKIEALANDIGTVDYKKITTSSQKKPSLLSRRASSEKLGTEACPNFSLMDEIDFDDDFQTESPNPSIPQFDLFGTGEFQPVVNDCEGNESGKQNESLKSGNLSKEPLSSVSKKDPSKSNLSNSLGELGSLTKMSSKRTPKRSSSEDDSLLNSSHSSKKVKLLKSPGSFCASQDTGYVWKRRERKACNVLGSDSEDNSFHKSNSESNTSSNSVLDKRKVTTNRENISFEEDDEEDFRLDARLPYRQSKPTEETKTKKLLKRKEKGLEFIEKEAQLSCDGIVVSSDESDNEDGYANDSFVNDCTELSQDPNVDIKAFYLKSIVSPVKRVRNQHLPKVQCLSDTDEHSEEIDESEDSFVVGNDVIEYNTEYMGESMLAEDSIMQEAIRENFKCNKIGESRKSQKNKRKRIVVKDSSSEEETEEKKKLKVCEQIDKEGTEVVSGGEKQGTPDKRVNKWGNVLQSDTHEPGNLNEEITSISEKSDFGLSVSERVNIDRTSLGITPRKSLAKRLTEKKVGVSCSSYDQSKLSKSLKKSHEKDDDLILHSSEDFDTPITSDIPVKKCFVNLPRLSSITAKTPIGKSGPQNTKSLLSRTSSSNIVPSTSSQETIFTTTSSNENAKIHSQIPGLVLVDSHEVNGGGQIVSRLKLHHGLNTAVVQLGCGQYAVSTRMIISRLQLSVFTNSQNRDSLKKRVQGMLAVFERSVIIVELDKQRHGDSSYNLTHVRSKYMDTITCACAQVNQLKVLYSSGQEETSQLIWQLVEQEKKKGFNIPVLPAEIQRWQQVVNFFRSLPRISFATALCLARNFRTLHEFFNSTPEVIAKKGCMSHQRAADVHQLISRRFRADMLS